MKLHELFSSTNIITPMRGSDKDAVFSDLAALSATAWGGDQQSILDALEKRERQGPLSMGRGIAFPHARIDKDLDTLMITLGVIPGGVDLKAPDALPVRIVVLFVIPKQHSNLYLHALSAFLNFFSDDAVIDNIVNAPSADAVLEIFKHDDQEFKNG